jgi:hypothetical protein
LGNVRPEVVKVMKRLLLGIAILGGAAILGGCPIYPSQNEQRVCDGTGCYSCPDTSYSGACIPWQCSSDSDCASGYVCADQGTCLPAPPVAPDAGGDCSVNGCPDGFICKLANGVAQCVALGGGDAGGTADAGSPHADGGHGDAASSGDSASQGDGSDGSTTAPVPCNADTDCGGHGAKCIDGQCAAQIGLCSDGSQCVVQGSACVDGVCEARCNTTTPCPSGYGCDFTRGVCNLNPGACTGSGTSSCQGGAVCVEAHCVPPCSASAEAGAACATGEVCVNGGCIPDQAATFACANDGDQGLLANVCQTGFTCIHHDCYSACDPDAGTGCTGATSNGGTVCKNVTIETGTYGICATPTMLGSDCDPAQGKSCATGVCVDGYCK